MKVVLISFAVVSLLIQGLDAFIPSGSQQTRPITLFKDAEGFGEHSPDLINTSTGTSAADASVSSSFADSSSPFSNFDYNDHWYPVSWAKDLRLNEPTKVTVFDVDYVIAKISATEVIAMVDQCPHKYAALSEGRVTSSGHFQCAYHGWSFNGTTGECVEIPQIVKPDGTMPPFVPSRSCGTAVPVQIHQEMVWLFPGGGLEKALLAPPPPSVEEYDTLGFRATQGVRDMPVDWPILVSNICDADHGLFAHQSKGFDFYTASKECPIQIKEEFPYNGKGWILDTVVDPREKLLKINADLRGDKPKKDKRKFKVKLASAVFHAPIHRQMRRLDANNQTLFVGAFYVCPVGVGRSRFFGAGFSKSVPKQWLATLFLNNFLDQDTYLLATQQKNILQKEAEEIRRLMEKKRTRGLPNAEMTTRRKLFCYASPTEVASKKIEDFWDATLLRAPNRIQRLLQLDTAGAFLETPPRSFVLDRKSQNVDINPDLQDVMKNCERVIRSTKLFSAFLLLTKLMATSWTKAQEIDKYLKPSVFIGLLGVSTFISWVAKKMKSELHFKYTDELRRKDMSKVPTVWMDK